jgi:D-alanyl-D-alanine carboxypeptidase (penicillin-binding protein 5/6)
VVVDADTGNVIDAGNDRLPLPPASLTKVITALAAVSNLPPDADVPVSDRAAGMPADKMSLKAGQVWTLDELLHALLLASANDAAVALAEKAAGTVEGFQAMFASTAASLGMADNPVLADPSGLDGPEGVEGGNLVSARDLAIAARALLSQPQLAEIVATPVYYFNGPDNVRHRLTNHNRGFLTTYAGAVGVKTGFTHRAGACLIGAARRNGRTMLAVVLHGPNPLLNAEALLDKGFATPVEAELTTEALPPINLKPYSPPKPAVTPTAPQAAAPAAPKHAKASSSVVARLWNSWTVRLSAAVVLLALLARWLIVRRRRRARIFVYPRSPHVRHLPHRHSQHRRSQRRRSSAS